MGLLREARGLADALVECDPDLRSVPAALRDRIIASTEESGQWTRA
jgi:hypothetical protein